MRLLIIKTSSLGDIIHAFPMLHYLREKFPRPDHQIDWVVEGKFAELVNAHPDIDSVHCIDSKKWPRGLPLNLPSYDLLFDLQGNCKSLLITLQTKCPVKVGFGWKSVPEWPNLLGTHHRYNPPPGKNIREDYLFLAKAYFGDNDKPFVDRSVALLLTEQQEALFQQLKPLPSLKRVMVCPGSAWPNKQLSEESLIALLGTYASAHFVFVWGSEAERELAERLKGLFPESTVLERLPLPVLQRLMGQMDLVIAMDSLPLHLAGTTAVPTLSFFGPSSKAKYCPMGEQHESHQGACPYGVVFEKRCPKLRTCKTGACIKQDGRGSRH